MSEVNGEATTRPYVPPEVTAQSLETFMKEMQKLVVQSGLGWNVLVNVQIPQDNGTTMQGRLTPAQMVVNLTAAINGLMAIIGSENGLIGKVEDLADQIGAEDGLTAQIEESCDLARDQLSPKRKGR